MIKGSVCTLSFMDSLLRQYRPQVALFNRNSSSSKMHLIFVCSLVSLLMCCSVESRPASYSSWDEYQAETGFKPQRSVSECKKSDLCERCSKLTRNEVVYPLCCGDVNNVGQWCKQFLEFRLN